MNDKLSDRQVEVLFLAWYQGFIGTPQAAWQTINSLLKLGLIRPVSSDNPSLFAGNSYQLTPDGNRELLERS